AIVHLKSDGSLSLITDSLKEGIAVDTTPNLSADDALEIARRTNRGPRLMTDPAIIELYIFRGEDRDHLAYRVEMPRI
ncbi:hypothetical protein OFC17_36155, partial [Escherichia coli]|nr:hypothetical protein [Escherichia coli]